MTITEEAQELANELIDSIMKIKQIDYTAHKDVIVHDIKEYVFNGNWDHTIDIDGMQNIRMVHEDEYEQHMDEDEQSPTAFNPIRLGYYIDLC